MRKTEKENGLRLYLDKKYNLSIYNHLCKLNNDDINPELNHPANIYLFNLENVLKKLELLKKFIGRDDFDDLNKNDEFFERLSQYILSLDSFYDNIFLIIKCLKRDNGYYHENSQYWLSGNKHQEGKKFVEYTKQYHSFISDMMNKIKHDTPIIKPLQLRDNIKNILIKGFYFAKMQGSDKTIPDRTIHKTYKEKDTGFSFNHFIRRSVGNIFLYSYYLNKILFKGEMLYSDQKEDCFYNLFYEVENISNNFFIDEYCRPTSNFINQKKFLQIETPKLLKNLKPKKYDYNLTVSIRLDKSYKKDSERKVKGRIPYVGLKEL